MILISETADFSTNKTRTVSLERAVAGIDIECDTVITGMSAEVICCATYTDLNTGVIRPRWDIISGDTYASISESGMLTINPNADASTIVLKATYKGKTDTQEIMVTYKFDFELSVNTADTTHYCQGWGSIQHDTGKLSVNTNKPFYTVIIPAKSGANIDITAETIQVGGTTYYPCFRIVGKQEQSYNTVNATEWTYQGASGTVTCNGARMKDSGYFRCAIYHGWGKPQTSDLETIPYQYNAAFTSQDVNVEWIAISLGFNTTPNNASGSSWLNGLDGYANLIDVTYHIYDA